MLGFEHPSHMVTHPSTDEAQCCLSLEISQNDLGRISNMRSCYLKNPISEFSIRLPKEKGLIHPENTLENLYLNYKIFL